MLKSSFASMLKEKELNVYVYIAGLKQRNNYE